jgi:hypothetical protein
MAASLSAFSVFRFKLVASCIRTSFLGWEVLQSLHDHAMWLFAVMARRNTYGLSVTPVGYYKGAMENHSRGTPRELFCLVKMRYFRATGMIFPRLALLRPFFY